MISFFVYFILPLISFIILWVAFKIAPGIKQSSLLSRWLTVFAVALISVFFGFREISIGNDFESYVLLYEFNQEDIPFSLTQEWGYYYLNYLGNGLSIPTGWFFSLILFVTLMFLLHSNDVLSTRKHIVFFFAISAGLFLDSLNIIRHVLVYSFFIYSVRFILSGSILRYILVIILAGLIHKSAFALLPFYFFINRRMFETRGSILFFVLFAFVFFASINISAVLSVVLNSLGYAKYLMDESRFGELLGAGGRDLGMGFLIMTILDFVVLFFFGRKMIANNNGYRIFYNLHMIGLVMSIFFSGAILLSRLNYYFLATRIFSLAYFVEFTITKKQHSLMLFSSVIVALYIVLYIARVKGEDSTYWPFDFVFNN